MLRASLAALAVAFPSMPSGFAAAQAAPPRDTTPTPTQSVRFRTDEGTWMSVHVSPDGRTIVFDLLGDLYTVPITGGAATRIAGGPAWDAAPRFSPDGRRILFASDRTGGDQLWTIGPGGEDPQAVTRDAAHIYAVPTWAPDGQFVAVNRGSVSATNSAAQMTLLHVGGGSGMRLVEGNVMGPAFSKDGRWFYFSTGAEIRRLDRRTGEQARVVSGYQRVFRPEPSGDGRSLAFGTVRDGVHTLMLRNLETGQDRVLYAGLDVQRIWGADDLDNLPGYGFTPDDRAIVLAADGKIRRVDLATGVATVIPFTADVEQTVAAQVNAKLPIDDGPFAPRILHWAQPVDDGRLVFTATGKLFLYDTRTGQATPFADGPGLQFVPAVSPDGRWIAYVTWNDTLGGQVMKAPVAGGAPIQLTRRHGRYQSIAWSGDGTRLVLTEEMQAPDEVGTSGYTVQWLDANAGGAGHWIADLRPRGIRKVVPRPTFDQTGERIYYSESTAGAWELWSMTLGGTDRRRIAKSSLADEMLPSPDGRWLAFTERQDVYLAVLPQDGQEAIDVVGRGGAFPVHRLSTEGGANLYWLDGGRALGWSWGRAVSRVELADVVRGGTITPRTVEVTFSLPRAQGQGRLLLANARLITMKGDEVIERGDLLVENGRIAAVGPAGSVRAPAGTTRMDLRGKTIIPGLIDLHAHYAPSSGAIGSDLFSGQDPELLANLAYGVTTWRDPSARGQTIFALAELVEAGRMVGPRIFSSGDIFWMVDYVCCGQFQSLEQTRAMARRLKALGATSLKEKGQPRRDQVQWLARAAREEGLLLISDPRRGLRRELRTLMDGFTTFEHLFAPKPLKGDVLQLLAQLGTFYVPTIFISAAGEYVTTREIHDDPKARRFIPHLRLDQELRSYSQWQLPHDRPLALFAKEITDLVRAGGKVGLGSHGQIQGLGSHFELWMMASGGLTPLEAIRAATLWGAEGLGMQDDLGSLEPGKLADLIVLDRNPLVNLEHTAAIAMVMKGGTLWNGDTMDEVWPTRRIRPRAAWEAPPSTSTTPNRDR